MSRRLLSALLIVFCVGSNLYGMWKNVLSEEEKKILRGANNLTALEKLAKIREMRRKKMKERMDEYVAEKMAEKEEKLRRVRRLMENYGDEELR